MDKGPGVGQSLRHKRQPRYPGGGECAPLGQVFDLLCSLRNPNGLELRPGIQEVLNKYLAIQ